MKKQNDIAVLDDVIASLEAGFASLAGASSSFVMHHVFITDDFSSNEPFFNVTMDFTGSFSCGGPFFDGPGSGFDFTCCNVGNEA